LYGGSGNDRIQGGAGSDALFGDEGNDQLSAGGGSDLLHGGLGNDILNGGSGDDVLFGGAGNDRLSGDAGMDLLIGGTGFDAVRGGADNDILSGGNASNEDDQIALLQLLSDWSSNLTSPTLGTLTDDATPDGLRGDSGVDVIYVGIDDSLATQANDSLISL
jgi:Ca2+-binding RTX toxin-like protein